MTALVPLESNIEIGVHVEREFAGMTFNMDTIWATAFAGALVVLLGLWARRQLTKDTEDHIPTKLQILWESIVTQVTREVESNLGHVNALVVPLAVALFFFILFANWLEILPTELNHEVHLLPAPTADTNLTYAMALLVIFGVWGFGISQKGFKGYFSHFLEPYPWLFPLNLLEELVKPITLALRLFGNIFAGGIMLALIAGLITWEVGSIPVGGVIGFIFNIIWKLFDMAIGAIQAFIFALLTVLYFGMAGAHHGDDSHDEDQDQDHADAEDARPESKEASPAVAH